MLGLNSIFIGITVTREQAIRAMSQKPVSDFTEKEISDVFELVQKYFAQLLDLNGEPENIKKTIDRLTPEQTKEIMELGELLEPISKRFVKTLKRRIKNEESRNDMTEFQLEVLKSHLTTVMIMPRYSIEEKSEAAISHTLVLLELNKRSHREKSELHRVQKREA